KYNYVLLAAMDSGVVVSAVIIFSCLQYPMNGNISINTVQVNADSTGILLSTG
ncbi:hypothetical protein IW261DRAFT_1343146, partial [Armillaria novae-zelandiae]